MERSRVALLLGSLSFILLLSCVRRPTLGGGGSQVATLSLGKFSPPADEAPWERVLVSMKNEATADDNLDRIFDTDEFAAGPAEEQGLKVVYGEYKVLLSFRGAGGRVIYSSCVAEREKIHSIRTPTYRQAIKICKDDDSGSRPIGEVDLLPDADVSISPVLLPGKAPEPLPKNPEPNPEQDQDEGTSPKPIDPNSPLTKPLRPFSTES